MRNESKMIKVKEDNVKIRIKMVMDACEQLVDDGIIITYREVENITKIPRRTLQVERYRTVINNYKDADPQKTKTSSKEIDVLNNKILYLGEIIKQLNKENHNLKTKLLEEKKI